MYCSDVKRKDLWSEHLMAMLCHLGRYMILDNSHKLPEPVGSLGKIKIKIRIMMMMMVVMMKTTLNTKQVMYRTKDYTTFKMMFKKYFKWHCKKLPSPNFNHSICE